MILLYPRDKIHQQSFRKVFKKFDQNYFFKLVNSLPNKGLRIGIYVLILISRQFNSIILTSILAYSIFSSEWIAKLNYYANLNNLIKF